MEEITSVKIDTTTDPDELEKIFQRGDLVQLHFEDWQAYYNCWATVSWVLYEYGDQIVSLRAPTVLDTACQIPMFEQIVRMISEIEDSLDIPIGHLAISAEYLDDAKKIAEFYEADLNDGTLQLEILVNQKDNPVEIIAWIESQRLQGVSLGMSDNYRLDIDWHAKIRKWFGKYITSEYIMDRPGSREVIRMLHRPNMTYIFY